MSGSTVYRTKRRFVLGNLELVLSEEPPPGAARTPSGKEKALQLRRGRRSSATIWFTRRERDVDLNQMLRPYLGYFYSPTVPSGPLMLCEPRLGR